MCYLLVPFVFLLFSCVGCNHKTTLNSPAEIDSIIVHHGADSVLTLLKEIQPAQLSDEKDIAYYIYYINLCKHTLRQPVDTTMDQNRCIEFLTKAKDYNRLCTAYFIQGDKMEKLQNFKQATFNYKKAIEIADKAQNTRIKCKSMEYLICINRDHGNFKEAIAQANECLSYCDKAKLYNRKAAILQLKSQIFDMIGEKDSLLKCVEASIPYIPYVSERARPYFIGNIGSLYRRIGNNAKAKQYLMEALKGMQDGGIYDELALIAAEEGNEKQADEYWEKGMRNSVPQGKVMIFENWIAMKQKYGKYDEALKLSELRNAINDSITRQWQKDNVKEVQAKFDNEALKRQAKEQNIKTLWTIIILLVIVLLLIALFAYKNYIQRVKLGSQQKEINEYLNKIELLHSTGHQNDAKVKELEAHITSIVGNKSEILNKGWTLYNQIKNEQGNTLTWKKNDYVHFLEYYKAIRYSFFTQLEDEYKSLTPHNMFFLALCDMGFKDEDIQRIMHITQTSVRSIRHRIRLLSKDREKDNK